MSFYNIFKKESEQSELSHGMISVCHDAFL